MTASDLDHPTFADCAFFYDRNQDRGSYSGQSGDLLEGQSWRAGPGGGGSGVGVHSQPRVSYYFPKGVGEYHFGERHPMKPHRLTLTNHLVIGYGLHKKMDIYQPRSATKDELQAFHDEDYVDFLSRVTPNNVREFQNVLTKFNFGDDCPIFSDMWDYCRQYAGASLMAARKLISGTTDIAINWTGGLHHAKKAEASGFCYVNDIVLAILELLRVHARVLYIDIDIHHGDGVQEAFYNSNRVMTVSFHKYSHDFFPSTGHLDEVGHSLGKYFSLNIPLQDGIDNESYVALFKSVMEPTINTFQPSSIVLQCGADSLGCDRLGCFNLSIAAHGECVRFIKSFGLPLIVLGGGGYTIKNVARCWTYETAVLLDLQQTLPNKLPHTPYDDFFGPDFKLHPDLMAGRHRIENLNTRKELERIRVGCLERLRYMHGAPSVQMQEVPPGLAPWLLEEEEAKKQESEDNMDHRKDDHKANGEFFDADGDKETDGQAKPKPKLAVAPGAAAAAITAPGLPSGMQLPNFVRTKPRITGGASAVPSGASAVAGSGGTKKKKKTLVTGSGPSVVGSALGSGAKPTGLGMAGGLGGVRARASGSLLAGSAPATPAEEGQPMDQSA